MADRNRRFSRPPSGVGRSVRSIITRPAKYLQNQEGIENPAPTPNAIHDFSQQPKGFAYVSGIIDPTSRLTAILGASRSQYQIPQVAGQSPTLGLTVNGVSDFPSALINENQTQINNFQILAYQKR